MKRLLGIDDLIGNKKKGIVGIIPISRSTLYNRINDGTFPPSVKIGNRTCWKEEDIEEYRNRL